MTRSLYSKFILGYLIFGLLGFITIATFSSKMTRDYLVRYQADAMYDEANIIASSCSTMYPVSYTHLDVYKRQNGNWALLRYLQGFSIPIIGSI